MAQKQGGKGKQSSPSDKNYWARATAGKYSETHRERRIKRHILRQIRRWQNSSPPDPRGSIPNAVAHWSAVATRPQDFPRRPLPRDKTRVVLTETIKGKIIYPIFQLYVEGVMVESSSNLSACMAYSSAPKLSRVVYKLHDSGRREMISYFNGYREIPLRQAA